MQTTASTRGQTRQQQGHKQTSLEQGVSHNLEKIFFSPKLFVGGGKIAWHGTGSGELKTEETPQSYKMLCSLSKEETVTTR